jgi:glycerophosphoryl diester phosphodiesterase
MQAKGVTSVLVALFAAAACSGPKDPTATASTEPVQTSGSEPTVAPNPPQPSDSPSRAYLPRLGAGLPGRLDCLRAAGGVLVIGHRGGPTRDYPENAIETLERTFKAGTPAMEIDIAETKDGVLVLMHDDDLERTTTGEGLVSDHSWEEISKLKLKTYSKVTGFAPPTLAAALDWAVKNNAVVELDKKRSAAFDPIIAAVRAAKAENNVFVITYTDEQAVEVHQKAPDLVITATVNSIAHLDELLVKGVKADRLVAWTGVESPNPSLWKELAGRGVESAFGTLGPRSTSLDGKYWKDNDGSEYDALAEAGLPILVTDITDKVSRQLSAQSRKAENCGL